MVVAVMMTMMTMTIMMTMAVLMTILHHELPSAIFFGFVLSVFVGYRADARPPHAL